MNNDPAPVVQVDDVPPCGRCNVPGQMLARFPHLWKNQRGEEVTGFREAVLCSPCDAADPVAAQLLTLLATNGQHHEENLPLLVELATDWTAQAARRNVNMLDLADEEERFWRGEL